MVTYRHISTGWLMPMVAGWANPTGASSNNSSSTNSSTSSSSSSGIVVLVVVVFNSQASLGIHSRNSFEPIWGPQGWFEYPRGCNHTIKCKCPVLVRFVEIWGQNPFILMSSVEYWK